MSSNALRAAATGQATQTQNPVAAFSGFLDKFKPQLALALPKHLNADRMARLALTLFSSNEKLQACDARSIAGAIMTAGQLGLEIGVNGQGFLVPYGRTCTFVPGWKGLQDLVNRSGRATTWTGAVFEGDDFDYALGDSPFIRHRPGEESDPSKLTHVYAVGRVNGSQFPIIEVWTIKKVWKHRDRYNKVGKAHYSFRDPEMYARKIPLLQVLKYVPSSVEVSNAIAVANADEMGQRAHIEGDFVSVVDLDARDIEAARDPEKEPVREPAPAPAKRGARGGSTPAPTANDFVMRIDDAADKSAADAVLKEARGAGLADDQLAIVEEAHRLATADTGPADQQ